MAVSEQKPYFMREPLPYGGVYPLLRIKPYNRFKERLEYASLTLAIPVNLGRIGRIETNP